MARGGARPGSGRKPGQRNKRTIEQAAEVAASGQTPLDYLLSVMRDAKQEVAKRVDAAKAAAPYVHARLNAVELSGSVGVSHEDWLEQVE